MYLQNHATDMKFETYIGNCICQKIIMVFKAACGIKEKKGGVIWNTYISVVVVGGANGPF